MFILIFVSMLIVLTSPDEVGKISKEKCQTYAETVYSREESPLLLPQARQLDVSKCEIIGVPLIVGGTKANEKEFPHMAVIGYGTSPDATLQWHCGGALISERFVLTAAHCLSSRELGPAQKVRLGMINLVATNNVQEILVSKKIPHPEYKPPKKYNDIALFELAKDVQFTSFIRPACLNVHEDISIKMGIAIGFGKLSYESAKGSNSLMKVNLHLISRNDCSKGFSSPAHKITLPQGITESMLCAGELAGGKDTCQGDSGGPFQTELEDPYCMYNLIGITSFGKFCGFANSPGVYTKVSYYIKWIEATVWG